jgi:hypothetical protein
VNSHRHISSIVFGRSVLAAVWMASACAAAVGAQPTGLPEETQRALEENARKLAPITVEWERTRSSDFPESQFLAKAHYPPEARDVLAPIKIRYTLQDGMFYLFCRRMMPPVDIKDNGEFVVNRTKPLEPSEQEMSFDGKALYNGNPLKTSDQIIIIDKIERFAARSPQARLAEQYYLKEAGFLVPDSPAELRDGVPVRSWVLSMIADGARVESVGPDQVDGVEMQTVNLATADHRVRFTLDPRKGFAVRRRVEWTKSGQVAVSVDGSDFEKPPKSPVWLPRRIHVEWHTLPESPGLLTPEKVLVESYKLTELSNDPVPAERFTLRYDKPGTHISDGRLPGAEKQFNERVSYRQPAVPEDLNEVIKAATEAGYKPKSLAMWMMIVLGLNALAALVAALVYLVRQKRSTAVKS